MRENLYRKIFGHTDPEAQGRAAEELVRQGELEEFIVAGERICFIDPQADSLEEARLHLDTLHKLYAKMQFALLLGQTRLAAEYEDGINRLLEMYPDIESLEQEYKAQFSQMMTDE